MSADQQPSTTLNNMAMLNAMRFNDQMSEGGGTESIPLLSKLLCKDYRNTLFDMTNLGFIQRLEQIFPPGMLVRIFQIGTKGLLAGLLRALQLHRFAESFKDVKPPPETWYSHKSHDQGHHLG